MILAKLASLWLNVLMFCQISLTNATDRLILTFVQIAKGWRSGKNCRHRCAGSARARDPARPVPAAGDGRAAGAARRGYRRAAGGAAGLAVVPSRPARPCRADYPAPPRPPADLFGRIRRDERPAWLSHRKLLVRRGRVMRAGL